MAPNTIAWTDETIIRFLTSCAIHSSTRPNLDKVGEEFGITSTAAYKKLWDFKKKYHPDGGPSTPRKLKSTATPTTNKKLRVAKSASPSPSRPPKRKAVEMSTIVKQEQMEEEENGDENEDRVVKVKKEVLPQEGVFGPVNYFYC